MYLASSWIRLNNEPNSGETTPHTYEARIYEMLDKLLIDAQEIINEQSSQMSSSVFYEKNNYRPDKITNTISVIFQRSDKEGKK
jgi:hypothetical protein